MRILYKNEGCLAHIMTPNNFSWVTKEVAGSGYPDQYQHFEYYIDQGISVLINLTEKTHKGPLPQGLQIYHFPITDFSTPSVSQVHEILKTIENHVTQGDRVVVHCMAGCGRTGTILGLWLKYSNKHIPVEQLIQDLKAKRACSLETKEQLTFVKDFEF